MPCECVPRAATLLPGVCPEDRLHGRDREAGLKSRMRGLAQAPPQRPVARQSRQGPRRGIDVAERHQITLALGADDLAAARNVGRNDRPAGGNR